MKDGFLIINKPQWFTSFDVVAKVRKALGTKKVGHTGTLDPMATGVLAVCVGKATGLVNKLTCEDKIYRTTVKLGIETDTADLTGKIIRYVKDETTYEHNGIDINNLDDTQKNVKYLSDIAKLNYNNNKAFSADFTFALTKEQIEKTIKSFIGVQEQTPPIYSSVRVNGKKLYEYAREEKHVDIPSRKIEIYDIYDIDWDGKNELSYTVHCSKGTYIRTLNEDIAKKLGLLGTTMALERIKTGQFDIKSAIEIDNIKEENIISVENLFEKRIVITEKDTPKLLNGIFIDVKEEDGIYNIYSNNNYLGLGKVLNGKLKRYIIL